MQSHDGMLPSGNLQGNSSQGTNNSPSGDYTADQLGAQHPSVECISSVAHSKVQFEMRGSLHKVNFHFRDIEITKAFSSCVLNRLFSHVEHLDFIRWKLVTFVANALIYIHIIV